MLKRKTLTLIITLLIAVLFAGFAAKGFCVAFADGGVSATGDCLIYEDEGKTKVSGVNIPDNFNGKLVIPDGVKSIENKAFGGGENAELAQSLTSVVLPDSLEVIGDNAFDGCALLQDIKLGSSVKTIGAYAFKSTALTAIEIPSKVTEVGGFAFYGCTALSEVNFAKRTEKLNLQPFSFANCTGLRTLNIPDNTTVNQAAFRNCTSLLWVYFGDGAKFNVTVSESSPDAAFFPADIALTVVFNSKEQYNSAMSNAIFAKTCGERATYIVKVNCYVGASTAPVVYERLKGRSFNYVKDEVTGYWNTDTAFSALPVQDGGYSATTWYKDAALTQAVDVEGINALLNAGSDIKLYCHDTVARPVLSEEPVSWVYNSGVSYSISDTAQVLKALGCEQTFTQEQLDALEISVVFADENGNIADTPEDICENGVYSVVISLNSEYGEWAQSVASTVTINVNTNWFLTVMIVLLVVGLLAVAVTVSTAVIRKKVQQRNKKKQLSQKEIIEKFKAAGGETTLQ